MACRSWCRCVAGRSCWKRRSCRAKIEVDSAYGADHGHDEPVAAGHRRCPDGPADGQRGDRPARVHVQPDELQSLVVLGHWRTSAAGRDTPRLSSHFQVGSCQSLKFAPNFKVSTAGKTSKANGASLGVKIVYPTTPAGNNQASSQANIARVKVDLPKQLPSRLTTLQKACTNAQFEANPAGCPAASVIGHARVLTPLLPVPVKARRISSRMVGKRSRA